MRNKLNKRVSNIPIIFKGADEYYIPMRFSNKNY